MAGTGRYWTTVGSAGTLSAADLAKVSLDNAVIRLGTAIAPPAATAAAEPSIVTPQVSVVARYNITPVDGLFPTGTGAFGYEMQVTFRGTISVRLVQFDQSAGTETELMDVQASWPYAGFKTASAYLSNVTAMDFVNCAYYVEATLTASATEVGNPAEIAAFKVYARPATT